MTNEELKWEIETYGLSQVLRNVDTFDIEDRDVRTAYLEALSAMSKLEALLEDKIKEDKSR